MRRLWSRKGENGAVLVVGGSWLYHGAPFLVAMAAYRSGVDLVYVAVPEPLVTPLRSLEPSLIVIPLPDSKLTVGSVNKLLKVLPSIDASAIGPGLVVATPRALRMLIEGLATRGAGLVLDASALIPDILPLVRGRRVVMTPHAGEFKRLFGEDPGKTIDERARITSREAARHGVTLLLKGVVDVVSNGEKTYLNHTGTPAMTVGGSGDVLTGLAAGLLAKGMAPLECAAMAAYVNGAAGEAAARELGLHILPTDIINHLPRVMKSFDKIVE